MSDRQRILELLYEAVDEINLQLPPAERLERAPDALIVARESKLDSLHAINLIVAIEQKIEESLGTPVNLTSDELMSGEIDALETIGNLANYICTVRKEKP